MTTSVKFGNIKRTALSGSQVNLENRLTFVFKLKSDFWKPLFYFRADYSLQ